MAPVQYDFWQRSSDVFSRLKDYYVKDAVATPPKPPITQSTAYLCALLYTLLYIAPFYLSSTLRTSPLNSRDAPSVIRARVRAVGLTCIACTIITVYILAIYGHATPQETLRLLGLWPFDPVDVIKVLGLVMVLFTCSLYESLIVDGEWRSFSLPTIRESLFGNWITYRNLLVAPASEELVFRSLTVPLFLLSSTPPTQIVFLTPLVFGLAHVHHLIEYLQSRTPSGQRLPPAGAVLQGLVRSLFQFSYTSLFGFFAAFVFLRTGNFWAVVVAHSFCNYMGVPRVWGRVGQQYYHHVPPTVSRPQAQDKRNDDHDTNGHQTVDVPGSPVKVGNSLMQDEEDESKKLALDEGPKQLGIAWTVVYYGLMFAGAYGFYALLWPATESGNALETFHRT